MKTFLTLLVFLFPFTQFAQTIYSYTNSTTGNYDMIGTNISATTLVAGSTVNVATGAAICTDGGFNVRGFSNAPSYDVSSSDYVTFTLTPVANYKLLIQNFSIKLRRSNAGPSLMRLAYQIGSGIFTDKGSDDGPNNGNCGEMATGTWSGINVETLSSVTFRIYGFNASSGTGSLQIKDILITGETVVLPIELTSFIAKEANSNISLTWQTAAETNNDRFDIEESTDGFVFRKIAEVKGQGTKNQPTEYELSVTPPSVSKVYFRLKQIDFDGKFEYSKVESVLINNTAASNLTILNTVADDYIAIKYSETLTQPIDYQIFNAIGQVFQQGKISSDVRLNVSNLPKGIYFFKTGIQTKRFAKI